jgi:anti-sigma regulatory factor (Ser/Thr protein kinase)
MQYTISNNLQEITKIQQSFIKESANVGLEIIWVRKMNIVIDEILSNIIKYAYDEENIHPINITFHTISKTKVKIGFVDQGKRFNPLTFDKPNLAKMAEKIEEGGLGIHLVTSLVNNMNYQRIQNKNHLIVEMTF